MRKLSNLLLLFSFLFIHSVSSQDTNDKNKWTPKDIIHTAYLQNANIAPNNKMVVWTKRKGLVKEDKFVNDIYLTRLDLEKDSLYRTIQLTSGKENDFAPFFSKDSETIYFRSSRDKGKKLWSLSIYGGEAQEVFEFKNGISNVQWLDENTFTFISNDGKTLREQELEKKKDNVVVIEDEEHWKKNRIYQFNIKDKEIVRITDNDFPVRFYTISHDGQWIVYSTTQSRHFAADATPDPKYYLHHLADGTRTEILQGLQTPSDVQFTADNQGFYFVADLSSDPEWNGAGISELYHYDLTSNNYTKVNLNHEWGVSRGYQVINNDALVTLANGLTNILAFYQKQDASWNKSLIDLGEKKDHARILAVSKDFKKVVYEHSTAGQLPKYYVANLATSNGALQFNNEQELAKVNKKLFSKPITKHEIMKWKGWNDEEVTGLLFYPEDYKEGKKYPLVISIHGGPAGADQDSWRERWSTYPQIFAQKGTFVLKPNYHGSSNHGQKFVESIKGHYYDLEMEDILKGIEVLNQKGLIDKNKMGLMGWSNGAIISTMLTVQYPDLFKVCAAGAGDVNWTSDYGTCRFGVSFDQSYFGGAPWDDLDGKTYNEKYILKSPLFEMDKVKTPTIIFHGSEDRAVPRDQGWEYYRALQQIGKAPVRFLWFPGQPHGLRKITHQTRKMEEEIAWIDEYLFKTHQPKNETFKEDSPLAMLLKKEKMAIHNGQYGKLEKGSLIPEVAKIKKDSIAIGVFEVTNAQFKAYQSTHQFSIGKENHPAQVSFKDANSYTQWLTRTTGNTYRLPNAKEAKSFHKKAKKIAPKENTLQYWAGYTITKDEIADFQKQLKKANGSLVKEVGSFTATKMGDAEVYDLGGNVAEYEESGTTYGFGASDFVDAKNDAPKKGNSKNGFRVVMTK